MVPGFTRTFMELKLTSLAKAQNQTEFYSYLYGIETLATRVTTTEQGSFTRTFMELKPQTA